MILAVTAVLLLYAKGASLPEQQSRSIGLSKDSAGTPIVVAQYCPSDSLMGAVWTVGQGDRAGKAIHLKVKYLAPDSSASLQLATPGPQFSVLQQTETSLNFPVWVQIQLPGRPAAQVAVFRVSPPTGQVAVAGPGQVGFGNTTNVSSIEFKNAYLSACSSGP